MRAKFAALAVATAIALGVAASAQSQEPTASIPAVSNARAIDMQRYCARQRPQETYYPQGALSRGVTGRVVLDCSLTAAGALQQCQVVEESPTRERFGDTALKIACRYHDPEAASADIQRYERDGERRMRRTISFRLS